jgi:hypothetical protein
MTRLVIMYLTQHRYKPCIRRQDDDHTHYDRADRGKAPVFDS